MLEHVPGTHRLTAGGDGGFDSADFVAECRYLGVTPHMAQNHGGPAAALSILGLLDIPVTP
jgi:hypothetical protein